jgi:histidyl-tRNA synthetase
MIKRITGTKDILPEETSQWQEIENTARGIFSLYNYSEIRPPLIEEAALFNRSLGESTEIVQKQMFLIKKERDTYALRPEGTASIARAYIENNLDKIKGFLKLYYIGPMFRMERPQKGRLRQFHHLGVEVIGSHDPCADAEVISLADRLLESFSIADYKIKINSLGCLKDKAKLVDSLHKSLKSKADKLCPDCRRRLKGNILRILDCKNEACIAIIKNLSLRNEHLCNECSEHFNSVKKALDNLGINYALDPCLVRGLDYYTGTVFEIIHNSLGAQDALGAGGRYDNLVKELGGPDSGAIGFALGIERLLLVSSPKLKAPESKLTYLIFLGEAAKSKGLKLLDALRKSGIPADTDYAGKSLKGSMRKASDLGAKYVLILGEDELKKDVVTLKNMTSGEQKEVKTEDLIKELKC